MLRSLFENNPGKGAKKRKRNFWLYSLGEFVLIFLGILIALQVDNWNQVRQVRNLETVMLKELLENLKADLADVNSNIDIHTSAINSKNIALGFIDGDGPWHDSLATQFGELNSGTIFYENNSSYESLKSLGIDLIRNNSIRQQITHLYSASYDHIGILEERALTHTFESMNASMAKQLYMIDSLESYIPLDVSGLRESNEFRHNLLVSIRFNANHLTIYSAIREELQTLIENIEKELS